MLELETRRQGGGATSRGQLTIEAVLGLGPVIPVVIIDDAESGLPLADAIMRGGLGVIEITLRTDAALEAVRVIAREIEDAVVGVGTVLQADQLRAAQDAGASFAVSPGLVDSLVETAADLEMPYLPGAITPSEIMRGQALGLHCFKFFPAEASGGVEAIQALSEPLPSVRFCATGGIDQRNFQAYLDHPAVMSVGGVWPAPPEEIAAKNWSGIEHACREAVPALDRG